MNFEELESAWNAQRPANPLAVDLAKLKGLATSELKRRSRFFVYAIVMVVFLLIVLPLISVGNYRYAPPQNTAWYWTNFAIWMVIMGALLVISIRGLGRHYVLRAQSTDTVRALTSVSLANVEAEMREYVHLCWALPALLGFQLLGLYLSFPVTDHGWEPFLTRAGFAVGLPLLMGLVVWRHYRVNLKPSQARLAELLGQM
jgi:hypothetical protein